MKKKIKKEDKIEKTIKDFPQTIVVFYKFELFCVGCPSGKHESIEEGAMVHGKTDEEIKQLVEELNKII
jgi:hybrid cluster-associated redox disulfide protein